MVEVVKQTNYQESVQKLRQMFESSRKTIHSLGVPPLLKYRVTECVVYYVTGIDITRSSKIEPNENLG